MTTICPRCAHGTLDTLYSSPIPDTWDVLQCQRCHYCWRTSEPERRTRREAYPDGFKLTAEEITSAPEVPAIPPLRTAS
ncbi:non-oxidative hydroxyarylic acid decarboxylases subunit D [Nonomuraea basaltis]|uniref:non-oxidative hydroxyarylic acid decarboxylases subunit D n=1 Tax=Nonomuraea basaltis TaxID=2495887 RepID=UPI00110C6ACD|nr:non-oxidative hydroxyarylic acid decarboxylases subunit D [Nonomuraea basaltis]TMR96858.1 hypothetical protein EJK15_21320 [Nonomuraea basaltis]